MDSGDRKIKSFKDFSMIKPSYYNMLNKLVVVGEYRPGFFFAKKKFSIIVYYTPMKKKIIDIITDDVINMPFKRGDNISVVREWIKSNNYEITVDKKKV